MTIAFECELKIVGEEILRWLQNQRREGKKRNFAAASVFQYYS